MAGSTNSQDEFLSNILKQAETLISPPPIVSPLPRQWLPKFIRNSLKCMYLPVLILDLSMQHIAKKIIRPPFYQSGSCKKRGNCCYFILLPESKGIFSKMYFFWQTQINGFFVREKSPIDKDGNRMLVLGCRYLAPNGKCSNYFTRPSVCRKWPIVEHFGHPRILKGCGYQINLKKSYKKEPYLSHFKKIKQETADKT